MVARTRTMEKQQRSSVDAGGVRIVEYILLGHSRRTLESSHPGKLVPLTVRGYFLNLWLVQKTQSWRMAAAREDRRERVSLLMLTDGSDVGWFQALRDQRRETLTCDLPHFAWENATR